MAYLYQPVHCSSAMDDADRITTPSTVLLRGRIVWSRDAFSVTMTVACMLTVLVLFHIETSSFIWHHISPALLIATSYIELVAIACLWLCNSTDPGIIPRGRVEELEGMIGVHEDGELVTINGVQMRLKRCTTCNIVRPPRCSHCSTCDNCVDGFDHHCPWMGNCVGSGNYRFFYGFLMATTAGTMIILSVSIYRITRISHDTDKNFLDTLADYPKSIAVIVITFFALWLVGGMACMHTSLITQNVTTNESIKHGVNHKSPFSTSVCGNCLGGLCGARLPSRFLMYRSPIIISMDDADDL
eukprot:m.52131 g.52131  ORF g.52131 m.52131 type:complete len:300 (-) comp13044_c0_seq1:232-1131(-)